MQKSPKTAGIYLLKINHSDPQKNSVQIRNEVFDLIAQPLLSDAGALTELDRKFDHRFALSNALSELPFGQLIHFQP